MSIKDLFILRLTCSAAEMQEAHCGLVALRDDVILIIALTSSKLRFLVP